MTKVKEQIRIAGLLVRKKFRMLTDEQAVELEQWENTDNNKAVGEEILNDASFAAWNKKVDSLDVSTQWVVFLNRMQKVPTNRKVIRLNFLRTVAAVAAVLVLVVSVGVVWKLYVGNHPTQSLVEVVIEPGSKNAQLFLDNGEVIDLKDSDAKQIDEGDLKIQNSAGVLVYDDKLTAGSKTGDDVVKFVTNRLRIPRGGEYQLVLPDGSRVWLNSESEISYTVPFSKSERHVDLTGEAYFEVAHDENKPFVVATSSQTIHVLGTHFNVSAYSEDKTIVTTLVEGKVRVDYENAKHNTDFTLLEPNDQLTLDAETLTADLSKVDTHVYTAWKDGRFVFRGEPLESLLIKVSRWYDVEVIIKNESLKDIRFTGDLPRYKNMNGLLKIFETETSVHVEMIDENTLVVTK